MKSERKRAYDQAYYAANREEIRAAQKAYYAVNRERRLAYNRAYRKLHREQGKAYSRGAARKYSTFLASAKQRGISIGLHRWQFEALLAEPCFYCGDPLPETGHGLDRRRSHEREYWWGNVVPCCAFCNRGKGAHSTELEHANHIRRLKGLKPWTWSELDRRVQQLYVRVRARVAAGAKAGPAEKEAK